nr:polysaccharide biosynthesis C-terminal domain-containing protein [Candidatus Nitrosacidococcus tergens]
MLLARLLGASGYGVYASVMASILLLGVPSTIGLPTLIIRLFASYRIQKKWAFMRGLLLWANFIILILTLTIGAIVVFVVQTFDTHFELMHGPILWWVVALLAISPLNTLRSAGLGGLSHVILGQLPESFIMPIIFLILVIIWYLIGINFTSVEAIALRVVATTISFLIGTYLFFQKIPKEVKQVRPQYQVRSWIKSMLPLFFLGGVYLINTQTDVLMLAFISGSKSAGIYQATVRGAELVTFSLTIITMVIQPILSRLYVSGDLSRLQKVITMSTRVILLFSIPTALIISIFAQSILSIAFGSEFTSGANCLIILSIAQAMNAGMGLSRAILNMTGHEKDAAKGMATGALVNILLNALFIPFWDITGAAIATGISIVICNLILTIKVQKNLGLVSHVIGKIS